MLAVDVQPQFLAVQPVLGEVGILERRLAQVVADGLRLDFEIAAKVEGGLPMPLVTPAPTSNVTAASSTLHQMPPEAKAALADDRSVATQMIVCIFAPLPWFPLILALTSAARSSAAAKG
ncbi:hypothetical protein [Mesorhizobium sp. M1406]|uniref:hypothetical protein n=1 Tax=Mesorhizobium sp. M1406 TaxID=2957099 RepID=UPI003337ABD3